MKKPYYHICKSDNEGILEPSDYVNQNIESDDFSNDVETWLVDGYELHGNPFVWNNRLCQAVVLNKSEVEMNEMMDGAL